MAVRNLLRRLFRRHHGGQIVTGSGLDKDATLQRVFGLAPQTSANVTVREDTPLSIPAWYSGVRLLAWTIAYLPISVYKRESNGDRTAVPHPVADLLQAEPNPDMTAAVFRELQVVHLLLWGNAYAYIERNAGGEVVALWPLEPENVYVDRFASGRPAYHVTNCEHVPLSKPVLAGYEVLHTPALGFDGLVGKSIITFAREHVGEAVAAQQFAGGFYAGGAEPGLVAKFQQPLPPGLASEFRRMWNQQHGTAQRRIAVVGAGTDIQPLSMPLRDAQYIESRQFHTVEAARWLGLPPHRLQNLDKASFSNIAEQNIEFVQALLPWCRRFEQEYRRKLFSKIERQSLFIEHKLDGLLAADPEKRANAFATGLQNGYLSRNEVRRMLNLNSIGEQGDIYTVQSNLMDLRKIPDFTPGKGGSK